MYLTQRLAWEVRVPGRCVAFTPTPPMDSTSMLSIRSVDTKIMIYYSVGSYVSICSPVGIAC